jgi:hypothetical protein
MDAVHSLRGDATGMESCTARFSPELGSGLSGLERACELQDAQKRLRYVVDLDGMRHRIVQVA